MNGNENETSIGEWKSFGGDPVSDGAGDPDVVFAHVSDLHGQLTPRYQIYYDNPTSKPNFEFGDDDRVIKRGGGVPLLAAKLEELRVAYARGDLSDEEFEERRTKLSREESQ